MSTENNELLDNLTFLMSQVTSDMSRTNKTYQELVDGLGLDEIRNDLMQEADSKSKLADMFNTNYMTSSIPIEKEVPTYTSAKPISDLERNRNDLYRVFSENKLIRGDVLSRNNAIEIPISEIQEYNASISSLIETYIAKDLYKMTEYNNQYIRQTNIYLVKTYLSLVIKHKIKTKYGLDQREMELANIRVSEFNPSNEEFLSINLCGKEFTLSIEGNNSNMIGAFSSDKKRFQIGVARLLIKKCKTSDYCIGASDCGIAQAVTDTTSIVFKKVYEKTNSADNLTLVDVNEEYNQNSRTLLKLEERGIETIKMCRHLIADVLRMFFDSNPIDVYSILTKICIQEMSTKDIEQCRRFINLCTDASHNIKKLLASN